MKIPTVAYLTCIGGHGISGQNKGGVGARGYKISRRGRVVTRVYGPVTVLRKGTVRFRWLRKPRELEDQFDSKDDAVEFVRTTINAKCAPAQGYTLLKAGVQIHSPM